MTGRGPPSRSSGGRVVSGLPSEEDLHDPLHRDFFWLSDVRFRSCAYCPHCSGGETCIIRFGIAAADLAQMARRVHRSDRALCCAFGRTKLPAEVEGGRGAIQYLLSFQRVAGTKNVHVSSGPSYCFHQSFPVPGRSTRVACCTPHMATKAEHRTAVLVPSKP